jgi:peptidoglycan/xylan/chitin deacetylase (PgdA/CDA1 family)
MFRGVWERRLSVAGLLLAVVWAAADPYGALAAASSAPASRIVRVPILMYHYIRVNPNPHDKVGADLSVPPEQFALQMQMLASNGFHTITVDDLVAAISDGGPLPYHPIILTFDDGYEDFYTAAYPVLKRYGFMADSFIITGRAGYKGYLTWDQMRQMQAGGLVQFESHTVDHVEMNHISLARAQHELVDSKATLEQELGRRVDIFCYPSGRYNAQVEALLPRDGYIAGVSTRAGAVHNSAELQALSRVRIHGRDTLKDFARKVGLF